MIIPTIELERSLWLKGFTNVAGVDEAGRGPLAGPVTAGAVVIHREEQIVSFVRDSKLMTAAKRELAYPEICERSSAFGIGLVSAEEIDNIGIEKAVNKAMRLALSAVEANFNIVISYVLVDGSKTSPLVTYPSQRIASGDKYHYSIAAGSVLAKVTRDRMMRKMAQKYPAYGFESHVGYGTKKHLEALQKFGACSIHRKSFAPVKNLLYIME